MAILRPIFFSEKNIDLKIHPLNVTIIFLNTYSALEKLYSNFILFIKATKNRVDEYRKTQ